MNEDAVKVAGRGGNSLELALLGNGDFLVILRTFDTCFGRQELTSQFPDPINGGGDLGAYEKIKLIYESLKHSE